MIKYATMCYLQSKGKTLGIKKGTRDGDVNAESTVPPGGKVEIGETPLQCVKREVLQESGLELIDPIYMGTVLFDNTEREFTHVKDPPHFLVHIFRATQYVGQLHEGTNEGVPTWVDDSDLEKLAKHEGDRLVQEAVKSGRRFFVKVYHIGKKLDAERSQITYFD